MKLVYVTSRYRTQKGQKGRLSTGHSLINGNYKFDIQKAVWHGAYLIGVQSNYTSEIISIEIRTLSHNKKRIINKKTAEIPKIFIEKNKESKIKTFLEDKIITKKDIENMYVKDEKELKIKEIPQKKLKGDYIGMNKPASKELKDYRGQKPKDKEILVSKELTQKEKDKTVNHEIIERYEMNKGLKYKQAHKIANENENNKLMIRIQQLERENEILRRRKRIVTKKR